MTCANFSVEEIARMRKSRSIYLITLGPSSSSHSRNIMEYKLEHSKLAKFILTPPLTISIFKHEYKCSLLLSEATSVVKRIIGVIPGVYA